MTFLSAFPAGKPAQLFADCAVRLAGLAGAVLGWRPEEFWRATPAELGCVLEALANGGRDDAGPADTAVCAALMERFPDA